MNINSLQMISITKEFPGVKALDRVDFEARPGEIHALVGENGAGKSTLMKVLSGIYPHGNYSGEIRINGVPQTFHTIRDSEHAGIGIICQELALVKQMTVCENLFLGSEIAKNGIIDWDKAFHLTKRYTGEVGLNIDPLVRVINLGIGQQQLLEIAKALSKNVRILILDEPTAALANEETRILLEIIKSLKCKGVVCVYISHRLKEVFEIADRITVLRDGKTVCTRPAFEFTEQTLIASMVGRELTSLFPRRQHTLGETVMEVRNWTVFDEETNDTAIHDVGFSVRKGEVLGIAGLVGAGRTEMVMSLFGVWGKRVSGSIFLNGKELKTGTPHGLIKAGISLLTEDRKRFGLVLGMDVRQNATLASLEKISGLGFFVNQNEEIRRSNGYVRDLQIKTPYLEQLVRNLSGGNQQKVVIAKWLMTGPRVLIMDEPTRGIDVGAKYEIYNIILNLIDAGVCIVIISSELPEILGITDRVIVMHEGRITGEMMTAEATQERIMSCATGFAGRARIP